MEASSSYQNRMEEESYWQFTLPVSFYLVYLDTFTIRFMDQFCYVPTPLQLNLSHPPISALTKPVFHSLLTLYLLHSHVILHEMWRFFPTTLCHYLGCSLSPTYRWWWWWPWAYSVAFLVALWDHYWMYPCSIHSTLPYSVWPGTSTHPWHWCDHWWPVASESAGARDQKNPDIANLGRALDRRDQFPPWL